ncbi:MAG: DNA polymerase III subunit delta [Chromatiales bacterium]|nr:DNA polymerase III subunit delta [Chromatiales bacterium]
MRARVDQLQQYLDRELKPIYLISGDEPLQLGEAADAVRQKARERGFSGRDILDADNRFDWSQLAAEANSMSLFAEQRILDLRIPSGKPGGDGSKALVEYATRPPEDILLLITLPKLDKGQTNSKWFKALDKVGVTVQVWPVEGERLKPWIEQRMRRAGLTPANDVVAMLADRVEGNLLAATQEIEKLLLLYGPSVITLEQLTESVADSARYDVFGLVDSALQGKTSRSLRMLNGLRAEGTPAPVILWALTREIRTLCSLAGELRPGQSPQQIVGRRREIWDKRKPLVAGGLQRVSAAGWRNLLQLCSQADRAIKGQHRTDPWLLLQEITSRMSGTPPIAQFPPPLR